jgi:CRISPR/Cas system-associated exonuclease Cas4 (RecB family)
VTLSIRATYDLAPAVEAAIRELRRADPFLPVRVLVPSPLLGAWLSHAIFRESGHVAVAFERPEQLAWRLLEPHKLVEGWRPVPEFADLAMVLAAARDERQREDLPAYLAAALETRGFAPSVLRSLRDLDSVGVEAAALTDLAPGSAAPARLCLLSRLQAGLRRRLAEARLLSRANLLREAANAPYREDVGAVVACGLQAAGPALEAFLAGLAGRYPLAWVAPAMSAAVAPRHAARAKALLARIGHAADGEAKGEANPGEEAPTSLTRLQQGLFGAAPGDSEPHPLDGTVCILAASGAHLEAVEIARQVVDAVGEGDLGFGDVAVLLPSGAEAASFDAAFERAGIDALFWEGTPRIDPAARALSVLLDLLDRDLDRARVLEFLTTARVPWDALLGEDAEPSAAGWDRLSSRAGIVKGLDQWRAGLARARETAVEWAGKDDREADADRDVRLIDTLRRVVEMLAADLAAFPAVAGWSVYLDATLALLDRWIVDGGAVRERLERALRPLAAHAPAPARAEFVARAQALLATQTYRQGEIGEARVFVGTIAASAGLRFRLVFVPGLAERRFPSAVRPDPLLLDDERRALSEALPTTEDALEAQKLLFAGAVHAATERLVLSYPRVDANGREAVPSSFLLRAAEAATGRLLTTADLLQVATPGETVLGRAWPEAPERALDEVERDLGLVVSGRPGAARHLREDAPHFARAREAEAAGWQAQLTPWDGLLDSADEVVADWAARLRLAQTRSVSALQDLATCPYRHFLKRGLRLRKWEEPGRAYELDPLQRGSLVHEILERTFRELQEKEGLPLKPAGLGAAQAIARRHLTDALARAAVEGLVPHRSLLDPVEVEMRRDLDETLRREAEAHDGFVPAEFEREFDEVRFALGDGQEVVFRGKLDRVDMAKKPARVRVVDYKTGGFWHEEGEEFKGGRSIQLAVYNVAAAQLYPKHAVTEALYRYTTEKGGFRDKACADTDEARETLRTILRSLETLATRGVFAPDPGKDACGFCDFQPVCGPAAARDGRAARKKDDPRLQPLRDLRQIP